MQLEFKDSENNALFFIASPIKVQDLSLVREKGALSPAVVEKSHRHLLVHFIAKNSEGKNIPLDKLPKALENKYRDTIDALTGQNVVPISGGWRGRAQTKPEAFDPDISYRTLVEMDKYNVSSAIFHGSAPAEVLEQQIEPTLGNIGYQTVDAAVGKRLAQDLEKSIPRAL